MERRPYDTDLTDRQRETLGALLTEHLFPGRLGRPRLICLREIFGSDETVRSSFFPLSDRSVLQEQPTRSTSPSGP